MSYTTVAAHTGGNLWPSEWGTSGTLGIFCDRDFVADDGKSFQSGDGMSLTGQFVTIAAITIAASIPTYGSYSLPKTDVAMPINARYTGVIFDANGVQRDWLFSGFDLVTSLGNSISFQTWWNDNAQNKRYPYDTVPTTTQMNTAIAAAINGPATTTQNGLVEISANPSDSAHPVAVETHDTRLPITKTVLYADRYGIVADGITDDTAAWNSAIAAAYALKVATIQMPPGISIVSSIVLPAYSSAGNEGIAITIEGVGAPPVAQGTFPGTLAVSTKSSIIKSTTAGTAGVITFAGTPFQAVTLFTKNLIVRREDNPTGPGIDGTNSFGVFLDNVGIDTGRYTTSVVQPTHAAAYGIIFPGVGNAQAGRITGNSWVTGFYTGIKAGEHLVTDGVFTISGVTYLAELPANFHPFTFGHVEAYNYTNGFNITGACFFTVRQLAIEHADSANVGTPAWQDTVNDIVDASNLGRGKIEVLINKANVGLDHTFTRSGGYFITLNEISREAQRDVFLRNSADISLTDGVDTTLTFDTVDENSCFADLSNTARIKPTQWGVITLYANVTFASNATGVRTLEIWKRSAGVDLLIATTQAINAGAGKSTILQLTAIATASAAADYFFISAKQNSGGALNITATASPDFTSPRFIMRY